MEGTPIIGIDFSINKPAACIYEKGQYQFYSWPFGLSGNLKNIYRDAGVKIFEREDEKYKGTNSSVKMRHAVENSLYLSNLILSTLPLNDFSKTKIAFEGLSFGSSGDAVIQLGAYKYVLMIGFFNEGIPFDSMETYAPISLKKTAGASKKGMGKKEMIDAFLQIDDNHLSTAVNKSPQLFQKRTGNWIDHLDDFVDSYWAIRTFVERTGHLNIPS